MFKIDDDHTVPWDSRWRPIIGFPNYWISQYGQVFSMKTLTVVRPFTNNHGIKCIRLYDKSLGHGRGTSRSLPKLLERHWGKRYERDLRSLQ